MDGPLGRAFPFADDPTTLNDWETLLGLQEVGTGDALYLVIDDGGNGNHNDRVRLNAYVRVIPEPMTMLAVGMSVAGLGGYVRRRRRG